MDCQEIKKYLYPFIDEELERERSLEVQAHFDSCPLCSLEFESEKKIESVINEKIPRDKAPLALREGVIEQIELAEARSSFWGRLHSFLWTRPKHALAILTILAMVVSLFLIYRTVRTPYFPILDEVVEVHTNFLAGRLPLEILSSQPEEVFSWFERKLDFSVMVPRFPGEEIKLLGGRLGHLKDRDAAYLIYRSKRYKISFFVFDCTGLRFPRAKRIKTNGMEFYVTSLKGYRVIRWEHNKIACIVVSNMDEELLLELLSKALPSSA